jgi:hypothetical protein
MTGFFAGKIEFAAVHLSTTHTLPCTYTYMQAKFHISPDTVTLTTMLTMPGPARVTISIPDTAIEWAVFITAVDTCGDYNVGAIRFDKNSAVFTINLVHVSYGVDAKIGFTVEVPMSECITALRRMRDVIAEYASADALEFISSHPTVFE